MKTLLILTALFFGSAAFAGPKCTDSDKKTWLNKDKFQKDLKDDGYKIKIFKVTSGNCYEIYGWDKDSKKVEIYFHPVTAEVMKKRTY